MIFKLEGRDYSMSIMSSELIQAPQVVTAAISGCDTQARVIADECRERAIKRVTVAGRGSSLNAGIGFKFLLDSATSFITSFEYPSIVTVYTHSRDLSDTLYIVVSQSGASEDTLAMTRAAKESGALVVSVTNGLSNPVARIADYALDIRAGEENAVAATKTLTGELAVLYTLAYALLGKALSSDFARQALEFAISYPAPKMPPQLLSADKAIILSRGLTEHVAKECALKLTETCYIYTYAASVNEFQHGPKALVSLATPAILFAPTGKCESSFISTAKQLKQMGAYVIAFTDIPALAEYADMIIKMPSVDEDEAAIVYLVKMQQFVASLCEEKGLSPDAPRNLCKVTITQ